MVFWRLFKLKRITRPVYKNKVVSNTEIIKLPKPNYEGKVSVEEALLKRRSIREYKDEPLTLEEISQLLWAAQGVTSSEGLRTAPSAGALYPIEVYFVAGKVEGLSAGVYKYKPEEHELLKIVDGDKRNELCDAALGQAWVREAPAVIVISALFERTTEKYGQRGERYVYMEAGHVAQNISLQATALNLGTVTVGAFDDEQVKKVLEIPAKEEPLYLMPVGKI